VFKKVPLGKGASPNPKQTAQRIDLHPAGRYFGTSCRDTGMLDSIEKLLILQDRDRKIIKVREQLVHIPMERSQMQAKSSAANAALDAAKLKLKQIETDRKKLELEVDAKKAQIEKYSTQQLQTKKNEEYRALSNEIETCKKAIVQLEDQQIDLMEQAERGQKESARLTQIANENKRTADALLSELATREETLKKELQTLEANRNELAEAVDESVRNKYQRLLKHKGSTVVVGIQHGVCGGCHMTLSRQTVVSCCADQEIITCINCGRILYYTPDMDLAVAE
jgi:predicted  nucleic acid-binding Zn-ribbon protein